MTECDEGKNADKAAILVKMVEAIDICRFMRLCWLLHPVVKSTILKKRLFNIDEKVIEMIENPIQKATAYFLGDHLEKCV